MSSFSSFIEFVAAIYVTMSLDTLFSKSFWTPNYAKKVETTLKTVGIPEPLIDKLKNVISETSSNEQRKGSLLGVMMLMYSVTLLISIGFEPDETGWPQGVIGYYNALSLSAILIFGSFVGLSFCRSVSFKIILFVYTLVIVISVAVFELFKVTIVIESPWIEIIVVGTLLVPIIIQLCRNWLYSTIYLKYMEQKVGICHAKYETAVHFNKNDKISMVDPKYQDAVHVASVSQDNQDRKIGEFVKILESDVAQYVKVPSAFSLISSWVKYQGNYRKNNTNVTEQMKKSEKNNLLNESVLG